MAWNLLSFFPMKDHATLKIPFGNHLQHTVS